MISLPPFIAPCPYTAHRAAVEGLVPAVAAAEPTFNYSAPVLTGRGVSGGSDEPIARRENDGGADGGGGGRGSGGSGRGGEWPTAVLPYCHSVVLDCVVSPQGRVG